jgi:uncharacterized repeat protein (TIGR01451 family)
VCTAAENNVVPAPKLTVVKKALPAADLSIVGASDVADAGDKINYTITVENTGNVDLTNITLSDPLTADENEALFAIPGITDDGVLDAGETWTFTSHYILKQSDIDAGVVKNTATVTGKDPSNNDVSDVSDSGDEATDTDADADNDPTNDPTVTPLTQNPELTLLKTRRLLAIR